MGDALQISTFTETTQGDCFMAVKLGSQEAGMQKKSENPF